MNNTDFWIKTPNFGLRSSLFDPKMSIWNQNQNYAIYLQKSILLP